MRVVMVTNNVPADKMGGHERYVSDLASGLVQRGVETTIVAKRWTTAPRSERSVTTVLPLSGTTCRRNAICSTRFYSSCTPFTACSSGSRGSVRTPYCTHICLFRHSACSMAGRPYVYTLHAPVWRELLAERQGTYVLPASVQPAAVAAVRRLEQRVVANAATTLVPSEFMRSEVRALDAAAGDRTRVLPGGIDIDRFAPGPPDPRLLRGAGPHLFTARRLTPRTGVDTLIRAMPALTAAYPEASLSIAGSGPMEESSGRWPASLTWTALCRSSGVSVMKISFRGTERQPSS